MSSTPVRHSRDTLPRTPSRTSRASVPRTPTAAATAAYSTTATAGQSTTTAPVWPPFVSPTRSRFASEDRAGEATYYPAGSPVPMERRSDPPARRYYSTDRYVEEPQSYFVEQQPAPEPVQVKKKSKWKKIFSRKKKPKASTLPERPLPPVPPSTHSASLAEPPFRSPVPASDISTSRRYELRDPGFIPRHMSVSESRDPSLRSRVQSGSVFGPRTTAAEPNPNPFADPRARPLASPRPDRYEERWTDQSASDLAPEPPLMLVDEQSGNRVPRDSQQYSDAAPPKKKRTLGGTLKRLFKRKKKSVKPIQVDEPVRRSYEIEQDYYEPTRFAPPEPVPVVAPATTEPIVVVAPVAPSVHTHSSRSSAVPAKPAPVVAPAKTHSSRGSAPPEFSPRSSHSHNSARVSQPEVVVPVTVPPTPRSSIPVAPRTSIPVRTATGSSSVYRPLGTVPQPQRYPTGSSYRSTKPAPAQTTLVIPPPETPTHSESPSIKSIPEGTDRGWGEVRVPAEPAPVPTPAPAPRRAPTVSRPLGTRPIAKPFTYTRPKPRARFPAGPAPRTPYVHVPRPIPPPPVYPSLSTPLLPTRTGAGLEAQVQLIVTALRDLAAEDRHRTAVVQQRLAEERAWNEEERARDAELRELVIELARRSAAPEFRGAVPVATTSAGLGGTGLSGLGAGAGVGVGARAPRSGSASARTTPDLGAVPPVSTTGFGTTPLPAYTSAGMGEFGVREQVNIAAGGLGVGGTDVERLILIMRQGHEVTMQTFRALIETWRKDIDLKHQQFLAEQAAREAAREKRREKPIRWQPGVNIWQPA